MDEPKHCCGEVPYEGEVYYGDEVGSLLYIVCGKCEFGLYGDYDYDDDNGRIELWNSDAPRHKFNIER